MIKRKVNVRKSFDALIIFTAPGLAMCISNRNMSTTPTVNKESALVNYSATGVLHRCMAEILRCMVGDCISAMI